LGRNRIAPSQPSLGEVVLALDQTGHGYGAPPAIANGFGGPDGLAHLRSLGIVDESNIGLEIHSTGDSTTAIRAAIQSISKPPF
jgi:hypothetical protein